MIKQRGFRDFQEMDFLFLCLNELNMNLQLFPWRSKRGFALVNELS